VPDLYDGTNEYEEAHRCAKESLVEFHLAWRYSDFVLGAWQVGPIVAPTQWDVVMYLLVGVAAAAAAAAYLLVYLHRSVRSSAVRAEEGGESEETEAILADFDDEEDEESEWTGLGVTNKEL
jgi:hypothetical protein